MTTVHGGAAVTTTPSVTAANAAAAEKYERLARQWRYAAGVWSLRLELRAVEDKRGWTDQWHLTCAGYYDGEFTKGWRAPCYQSVAVVHGGAEARLLRCGELLSVVTGHIKKVHNGGSEEFPAS